jgi:hypothetical protein
MTVATPLFTRCTRCYASTWLLPPLSRVETDRPSAKTSIKRVLCVPRPRWVGEALKCKEYCPMTYAIQQMRDTSNSGEFRP